MDPEPSKIVGHRTRRDERSPSDWIRVMVDSFHDKRSAFEFAVNPAGVKQDTYWFNDNNSDDGWDAVWDVSVSRKPDGWRAEFKIPFSQLRFQPTEATTFGLAFVRADRPAERDVDLAAALEERERLRVVIRRAEWPSSRSIPETARNGAVSRRRCDAAAVEAGNSLMKGTDPDLNVGLDVKYALRPGLTLTGTVNPDFGQVEADPAVVNLSAFETFFSERRPFFMEGSGIFRFDTDCNDGSCSGLFYSRRIGRAPRGEPNTPDGGYASTPTQTTIIGASKLTGRIGGFSVGALNAVTAEESAVITDGLNRTPTDRGAVLELFRRPREEGIRQPVVDGLHHDLDEPQSGRGDEISPRSCLHRRAGLGLAGREAVCDPGLLGGEQRPWRSGGDSGASGEHRSQLPATRFVAARGGSDPHVAQRLLHAARVEQDRRPARALQLERRR